MAQNKQLRKQKQKGEGKSESREIGKSRKGQGVKGGVKVCK